MDVVDFANAAKPVEIKSVPKIETEIVSKCYRNRDVARDNGINYPTDGRAIITALAWPCGVTLRLIKLSPG